MTKAPRPEIKPLTPALAAQLLAANTKLNRPLIRANVDYIKSELVRGAYTLNNDAVTVSVEGALLNGQHRCKAVVESGITIPQQLFLLDAPPEIFANMDSGAHRTLAVRAQMDPSLTAEVNTIAYIAGLLDKSRRVKMSVSLAQDIAEWWGPAYGAIRAIANRASATNRWVCRSDIGVAAGLRWALGNAKDKAYIQQQLGLLRYKTTVQDASRQCFALHEWMGTEGVKMGSRLAHRQVTTQAFWAFNRQRAESRVIRIQDRDKVYAQIKDALSTMETAFLHGTADNPYRWQDAPILTRAEEG